MLTKKRMTFLLLVILFLVAACSPATGLEESLASGDQGSGGTFGADSGQIKYTQEPPPATLSIDGRSQTAGIGGYCWNIDAEKGICADKVGVPTDPEPLVTGDTFLAEFQLPTNRNPESLSLFIYQVPEEGALPGTQNDWRWWPYQTGDHHRLPPLQQPSIDLSLEPGLYVFNLAASWREYGDVAYGFLVYVSAAVEQDTASFAEAVDISLEEARRRLAHQDSIGEVQEQLMTELTGTFAGLWVDQQPAYRVNIALTDGDKASLQPYIGDKEWAEFVDVHLVPYSLARLQSDQLTASRLVQELNVPVITVIELIKNRVEVIVGNPGLLQDELNEAGLELPQTVFIQAIDAGSELPESNRGVLLTATTADGRTINLPKQAPTNVSMAALIEGPLLEVDGCLRISDDNYPDGFMVIWPYDADIRVGDDMIEVLNGAGQAVARVGERLRAGGGAMESPTAGVRLQESIPDLPVDACPGPYWIAGEMETLVEQQVPDIYFEPFSSNNQILAWYVNQSRPSPESDQLLGELVVGEDGCMRVEEYLVIWPPGVYLREEPLRIVDMGLEEIAQVGDRVQLSGAETSPADYRYFENKVDCDGPYWGVNGVSRAP